MSDLDKHKKHIFKANKAIEALLHKEHKQPEHVQAVNESHLKNMNEIIKKAPDANIAASAIGIMAETYHVSVADLVKKYGEKYKLDAALDAKKSAPAKAPDIKEIIRNKPVSEKQIPPLVPPLTMNDLVGMSISPTALLSQNSKQKEVV